MRIFRNSVLGAILLTLALVATACGGSGGDGDDTGSNGDKGSITVGSDSFPEAQIVGEMYAQVLENAGFEVERQLDIESREVRLPAMESGELQVAPEYVASLLSVIDPDADISGDVDEVAGTLEGVLGEKGLEILEPSAAVDTNAFVVTQEVADQSGLSAVSDLEGVASDMVLGAPAECPDRPFCIPGLKEVYNVEFGDFKALEYGAATVQALSSGAVDVALLFSTDPLIDQQNLVLLEDDKGLQSADNIVPLVSSDIAEDVAEILNEVSAALTTENITQLNARVAIDAEDPEDVAQEFLEEEGLI
ncbi:MAG: glycine/betaine ABC transporter substrate-binding protein [Actinobacteria bacterium]|nr:glycine/betaine ABC transporter substrate-binding protein [Actinomycetota bacterium]